MRLTYSINIGPCVATAAPPYLSRVTCLRGELPLSAEAVSSAPYRTNFYGVLELGNIAVCQI